MDANLTLGDIDQYPVIDVTIDGADEYVAVAVHLDHHFDRRVDHLHLQSYHALADPEGYRGAASQSDRHHFGYPLEG